MNYPLLGLYKAALFQCLANIWQVPLKGKDNISHYLQRETWWPSGKASDYVVRG